MPANPSDYTIAAITQRIQNIGVRYENADNQAGLEAVKETLEELSEAKTDEEAQQIEVKFNKGLTQADIDLLNSSPSEDVDLETMEDDPANSASSSQGAVAPSGEAPGAGDSSAGDSGDGNAGDSSDPGDSSDGSDGGNGKLFDGGPKFQEH